MSANNRWGADVSFEMKLLRMPFEQMVCLMKDLEDLDDYVLMKLEEEKPAGWEDQRKKVFIRKEKRFEFIAFRVALELGMDFPPKRKSDSPDVH